MESTDYETVLAKLHHGAVVEIRELDSVWSTNLHSQRVISNLRLAFVLAHERSGHRATDHPLWNRHRRPGTHAASRRCDVVRVC
jgi:hypothetical protein